MNGNISPKPFALILSGEISLDIRYETMLFALTSDNSQFVRYVEVTKAVEVVLLSTIQGLSIVLINRAIISNRQQAFGVRVSFPSP